MYQPWGHIKFINPRAYQPSELYIFDMALVHKTGTSRMVDHTLIDVPLANVYLDSLYYKGHCRVMCVSSTVYPVIIGNVRGARRCSRTGRLRTSQELEPGPVGATRTRIAMITSVVPYLLGCLGGPTRRLGRVLRRRETLRETSPAQGK